MTKEESEAPQEGGETQVWGYAEVADEIGVKVGTVRYYWSKKRHLLPNPDVVLNGKPGWYPATVKDWKSQRPGRGFRSDLQDQDS
ncbi:MarR family transcriptional regulator [Streptomyces sp. IBSBF 2950]|uniref:MarR family transcriptional regulator n=1 Tax=Streptomyces sp. IBSBF 2950 TaxID=2903528 RepID=UPI002FDC6F9A